MNIANPRTFFSEGLSALPRWQRVVFFSLGYFLCAWLGVFLSPAGSSHVSFWLPAGWFVAILLLHPARDWLWLALAVLPASVAFELIRDPQTPPALILIFYFSNVVRSVFGAWLVRRFVAETPTLTSLRQFLGLMGWAGLVSAMVGATLGAASLQGFGLTPSFFHAWFVWWSGSAMAVLVFSPLLLAWLGDPSGLRIKSFSLVNRLEVAALFGGMSLLAWYFLAVGGGVNKPKVPLLIFVLWAGVRFSVRGAALTVFWLAVLMAYFTTHYPQELSTAELVSENYMVTLQVFLAVAAFVGLIPAIILAERDQAMAKLRDSENRYRSLTEAAFEGVSISDQGIILDMNDQGLRMFGYPRDEMIGKPIVEVVAPGSRILVAAAIQQGLEAIYEHECRRRDGTLFHVEARARMVQFGGRMVRMTAVRDITERRRAEAEHQQAMEREQQARAEYTLQLIAAQEAERTRIAGELHDSLGQNLLLIKNRAQLAVMDGKLSAELREQLKAVSELASQSIAEARQISYDLHPYQLDHLGLTRALEVLAANTAQASGMTFDRRLELVDDLFPGPAATNFYRIVQESLNNILKHSRAKNVRLRLERDVREVQLLIQDDGCGFDRTAAGSNGRGMGLKNIAERVRFLGGTLKMESSPGHGLLIAVTIPFTPPE